MAKKSKSNPLENLNHRAFDLMRRWMKEKGLDESETYELLEIIMTISGRNLESKFDAKFNMLMWAIGIGTALIVASNFIT